MHTDLLIVGGGLAGTLLALEVEKRGLRVTLVDDNLRDAATPVAAGLINPVTGMRLTVAPDAGATIPFAIETFRELERRFGRTLFREIPIFRAYENEAERALKIKRAADPAYARWFGGDVAPDAVHPALHAPLGGFFITGGGWVDLPAFLAASREYFVTENVGNEPARVNDAVTPGRSGLSNDSPANSLPASSAGKARASSLPTTGSPACIPEKSRLISLIETPFANTELEILPDSAGVRWRGLTAKHIVFAEGAGVLKNPWFAHLAWQPAKGEFITCDTGLSDGPDYALKIDLLAIPLGDGRWRAGSNYEWNNLDTSPTPAIGENLLSGFEKMFRISPDAVVVQHRAGIRPAARGATPVTGPHPEHPALHVFNGFGAKGCTWVPSYARDYAARLG